MSNNVQGTGNANPSPMTKTHAGIGNHKQRFTSEAAVKSNAPGSPKTTHTGQRGKSATKDMC